MELGPRLEGRAFDRPVNKTNELATQGIRGTFLLGYNITSLNLWVDLCRRKVIFSSWAFLGYMGVVEGPRDFGVGTGPARVNRVKGV